MRHNWSVVVAAAWWSWVIVGGLGSWVGAQEAEPSQQFRYRFSTDAPLRYVVSAQMTGTLPLFGGVSVENMRLEMALRFGVRQMRSDGNIDLGVDVEQLRVEIDGQPLPFPLDRLRETMRNLSYVITPWGEVVEQRGSASLPFNLPIPGLEVSQLPLLVVQLVFPKEAISPGHEWTYTRRVTANASDSPAQLSAKWLRNETVQGVATSLFSQRMRWSRRYNADTFDQPTSDERLVVKRVEQSVVGDAQVWFASQAGSLAKAVISAQYEQKAQPLNGAEAAGALTSSRLSARVQVVRADLTEQQSKP